MKSLIIGIDCAVDPSKVGVATAITDGDHLRLESAELCSKKRLPLDAILEALSDSTTDIDTALLAFDAPLGWPEQLGTELANHRAGERISTQANQLFRRTTDHFIKDKIGKQPLEVGADRIARTAVAALQLLNEIRIQKGEAIPLTWHPEEPIKIRAIETYPAATLTARRIKATGYKRKEDRAERALMLEELRSEIDLGPYVPELLAHADVLDAAICTLAGWDFLRGECFQPVDEYLARHEGWIWVRRPEI